MSENAQPQNPETRPLTEGERLFIDLCHKHAYSHVWRLWADGEDGEREAIYLPCTRWQSLSVYTELPQIGFTWYFWTERLDPRECIPIEDAIRRGWIVAAENGPQRWLNCPGSNIEEAGRFGDIERYKDGWHPAPKLLKRGVEPKRDMRRPRWADR